MPMDGQPPDMAAVIAAMQEQAEPEPPPPLAERLPATSLWRMYQAWETAKTGENVEMYDSARYYHGHQWTDTELKALKRRGQPPTFKNLIRRKIDFLVGLEQRLRRDPKCFPRNPGGEAAAPVATSVLRAVQDMTKWPGVASECARDALIRGIGAQSSIIVRNRKGKFDIKKYRVKGDAFLYDPRSEEWNFDDALYLGEAQWMDVEQAKELLPWAVDILDQMGEVAAGQRSMLPQLFDKEKNWTQWVDEKKKRVFLVNIWYRYKGEWLFDFLVGEVSLCPPDMDCLSPYIDENDASVHPYVAWSPYVGEDTTRYGMIRDLKPMQDEVNKRSSKALHLLTVRQTMSEKGIVADVDSMKLELAKPDGHVLLNPGGAEKFKVIEQTAQIQGNLELMQDAAATINNMGPNPALEGKGVESQSGRAILAQQNSGMAELSPVYERMREWKLRCYHKDWNLIRKFYTDDRYIRITGDAGAVQHLRINAPVVDPMSGQVVNVENQLAEMDVDIILDEGPDTVTMREELIEQLSDRPDIPTEILVELSNLPDKDALLKKLQEFKAPPPELQELQKRMSQLEEMTAAANLDKARADTESTRAGTVKTLVEAGVMPQAMEAFPFYYREPTFLDQAQGMAGMPPNALAGPQGGQPPGLPSPTNALSPDMGGGPPGAEANPDFLAQSSTPWLPGEEPQLNQAGGLPMPAGGV